MGELASYDVNGRRLLVVDAAHRKELQAAAIAVVYPSTRKQVAVEIISTARCNNSNFAEGMAVARAISYLSQRAAGEPAVVRTDCRTVVKMIERAGDTGYKPRKHRVGQKALEDLGIELAEMMTRHNVDVEEVGRQWTQPAHVAARNAMKLWMAGADRSPTWSPPPYLRFPEPV